ncbi:hypothetical protein ALI144C_06070 [Actinosynnema sp. ALI-1.44]|nr:hypothetical protein ALI144C_06070 [Actinosynnema sp. ALI-1.44]
MLPLLAGGRTVSGALGVARCESVAALPGLRAALGAETLVAPHRPATLAMALHGGGRASLLSLVRHRHAALPHALLSLTWLGRHRAVRPRHRLASLATAGLALSLRATERISLTRTGVVRETRLPSRNTSAPRGERLTGVALRPRALLLATGIALAHTGLTVDRAAGRVVAAAGPHGRLTGRGFRGGDGTLRRASRP